MMSMITTTMIIMTMIIMTMIMGMTRVRPTITRRKNLHDKPAAIMIMTTIMPTA